MIPEFDKTMNCATVEQENTTLLPEKIMSPEKSKGDGESQKIVRIIEPDFDNIPHDEMKDNMTNAEFDALMQKYSPEFYDVTTNTNKEDEKIRAELQSFIDSLEMEDYYNYITGKIHPKDKQHFDTLLERSDLLQTTIKCYNMDYEEVAFDDEKFWKFLQEEKEDSEKTKKEGLIELELYKGYEDLYGKDSVKKKDLLLEFLSETDIGTPEFRKKLSNRVKKYWKGI